MLYYQTEANKAKPMNPVTNAEYNTLSHERETRNMTGSGQSGLY